MPVKTYLAIVRKSSEPVEFFSTDSKPRAERILKLLRRKYAEEKFVISEPVEDEFILADQNVNFAEMLGTCEGKRAIFLLSDHPYTETPQARATMAEILRYNIELTRAKNVTETHARRVDGALEVKVKWL